MALSKIETQALDVGQIGGRRNLIINGAMQVWQRGTSQSGANAYGSADRWFNYANTHGVTYEQGPDAPDGFTYSLTTSGTPTGDYIIVQPVELPATGNAGQFYSGQTMTLSYYAKSTDATDELYTLGVFRDAVTSVSNQVTAFSMGSERHSLSTSWQRFTFTFSIIASPSGTNKMLSVLIRSLGNANGNISITGVQLEVGSVATPFEHRSFGEELALCQRYYWRFGWPSTHDAQPNVGLGFYLNSGRVDMAIDLPVTMRSTPVIVANSGSGYWNAYVNGDDLFDSWSGVNAPTNNTFILYSTDGVSGSAGNAVLVGKKENAASLAADAEL